MKLKYLVINHTKPYLKSLRKTQLLRMTDTRNIIWIWRDLRMFSNACAWLADVANAICHNKIWCASYQLLPRWSPYKEITWYKQHNMCAMHVCSCSVLLEYFDFQSFAILHELDTLYPQLLKNLNLSCISTTVALWYNACASLVVTWYMYIIKNIKLACELMIISHLSLWLACFSTA